MSVADQEKVVALLKEHAAKRKSDPPANRFKGKYAGPDKYKGKIPEGYKGKAKGEYFGKDSRQGANVPAKGRPAMPDANTPRNWIEHENNLPGNKNRTPFDPNNPGTSYKWKGAKPTATMVKKYKTLKSS